jgi:outer membrane protein OmpA-like peptidoglycan-associated protein
VDNIATEGTLGQYPEGKNMKTRLVALAISCVLFQSPLTAQESDNSVEKGVFAGSMIGAVAGALFGGPPGVVLGLTGGAMLGELEARKEQLVELDRQQRVAEEHQAIYQHQKALENTRLEAMQQGYALCLGFRSDSAEIEAGIGDQLKAMVVMLQAFPELKLQIRAGADARGSDIYNESLSKRRAMAVAKLLKIEGISQDRMEIFYLGEAQARYPVEDLEGLAYDRMVHLTLIKGEAS